MTDPVQYTVYPVIFVEKSSDPQSGDLYNHEKSGIRWTLDLIPDDWHRGVSITHVTLNLCSLTDKKVVTVQKKAGNWQKGSYRAKKEANGQKAGYRAKMEANVQNLKFCEIL